MKKDQVWLTLCAAALTVGGCAKPHVDAQDKTKAIKIDGSSTVYLISQKMAEEFSKANQDVHVTVSYSGTGGGFKKFIAGETDINDASRSIKSSEADKCKAAGIDPIELQVAWDGIAVVINKENDFAKKMTAEQLKKIWHPKMAAKKWSDINPEWPDEEIKLFGPGNDSGTFDYFTDAINGEEKLCRSDFQASEDDNVIVKGVEGNKYALGYFGVAYYVANKDRLGTVAVAAKEGDAYVLPTKENVLTGKYKPLSRPLFIYVKKSSLKRTEVQEFAKFYLRRDELVDQSGYVRLDGLQKEEEQKKLDAAIQGAK